MTRQRTDTRGNGRTKSDIIKEEVEELYNRCKQEYMKRKPDRKWVEGLQQRAREMFEDQARTASQDLNR